MTSGDQLGVIKCLRPFILTQRPSHASMHLYLSYHIYWSSTRGYMLSCSLAWAGAGRGAKYIDGGCGVLVESIFTWNLNTSSGRSSDMNFKFVAMGPSSPSNLVPVPNRQHRKSKNGCLQCKQRKVKVGLCQASTVMSVIKRHLQRTV